jgi:hypothetical protein
MWRPQAETDPAISRPPAHCPLYPHKSRPAYASSTSSFGYLPVPRQPGNRTTATVPPPSFPFPPTAIDSRSIRCGPSTAHLTPPSLASLESGARRNQLCPTRRAAPSEGPGRSAPVLSTTNYNQAYKLRPPTAAPLLPRNAKRALEEIYPR